MNKFTRTVVTTDITAHMHYKKDGEAVSVPLPTITVPGEYAPLKAARKARKDDTVKDAVSGICEAEGVKSYDITAECVVHEKKYSMTLDTFMQYATVEEN